MSEDVYDEIRQAVATECVKLEHTPARIERATFDKIRAAVIDALNRRGLVEYDREGDREWVRLSISAAIDAAIGLEAIGRMAGGLR